MCDNLYVLYMYAYLLCIMIYLLCVLGFTPKDFWHVLHNKNGDLLIMIYLLYPQIVVYCLRSFS